MSASKHTKPGVWTIPAEAYHQGAGTPEPSLSASIAHLLLTKSPLHAYDTHPQLGARKEDHEEKFELGTAFHALKLEGRDLIHEVEAPDWKRKDAQQVRKVARENGLIPMLSHQYARVLEMEKAVDAQIADLDLDPALFTAGKPEQTIVWQEPNGVWCRALIDWLHDDYSAIDDIKTAGRSANPHEWSRTTLWNIGADIQVAFHSRGVQAATGQTPAFRYLVAETMPPYAVSIVSLAPDALALAEQKVQRAIDVWGDCLASGDWPAYTRQIAYAELPPWTEARWLEQRALEEMEEAA